MKQIPSVGSMVRLVNFGTPTQRSTIWIVEDHGILTVKIHRYGDPTSWIWAKAEWVEKTSPLAMLAAQSDE